MVRSHAHASAPRRIETALEGAVVEARRFLQAYDEFVLHGHRVERGCRLEEEGRESWCRGTVRFDIPRQPFLFQHLGRVKFEQALHTFHLRLTGTLEVLRRQGATPLDGTPTARAFRAWLRRCLAAAAEQLESRRQYRNSRRGGVARIGSSVDGLVTDVQEVLVPWSAVRDFAQPILNAAQNAVWEREDQPRGVPIP